MTWNYRIIRNEEGLRIFDVYYDAAGKPSSMHAAPAYVYGETVDDLRSQLTLMLSALERPVIEEIEVGRK